MVRDGCNYFSFWAIFHTFNLLTAHKIKIFEKWKKHLEISSFYVSVPKIIVRWCTVPEIRCVTDVIVISYFGLFLPFYPPNSPKNQNFVKMKKNTLRYHHFTYVQQKLWSGHVRFLRYGARRTDGWTDGRTDGRTEKVTCRGRCPT